MAKQPEKAPTSLALPEGFDARDYQDERAVSLGGDMAVWKPSCPVPLRGFILARQDFDEKVTSSGEVLPPWSQLVVKLTKPTLAYQGGSDELMRCEPGDKVLVGLKHGLLKLGPAASSPTMALEVIIRGLGKQKLDGLRHVWRFDLQVIPIIRSKAEIAPEYATLAQLGAKMSEEAAPALPAKGSI